MSGAAGLGETISRLRGRVTEKILTRQGDIPTFFDNYLLQTLEAIEKQIGPAGHREETAGAAQLVRRLAMVIDGPRFVPWPERAAETREWHRLPWELTRVQIFAGQGVAHCIEWRGLPLFKSAYDFAMYPMLLAELRPATIVELGSGSGASAIWLADTMRSLGMEAKILSMDIRRPEMEYSNVEFVAGDVNEIETIGREGIAGLAHPWLAIEDSHVNTCGVLEYFAGAMEPGDYLIVEDSFSKQQDLARFQEARADAFQVDTKYTDFFGRNTVSAVDSVFIRGRKV